MASEDQEQILNQFETSVLDQFHTKYRLWREDRSRANFAILSQFDIGNAAEVAATPGFALSPIGMSQAVKGREEGLAQALRWLTDNGRKVDVAFCPPPTLIKPAIDFANFAKLYVDVADFHKMYRRGQIDISVDASKKHVKFIWPDKSKHGQTMLGVLEKALPQLRKGIDAIRRSNRSFKEDAERSLKACDPYIEQGRVMLRSPNRKNLGAFLTLEDTLRFDDYEFYDPAVNLDGFTIEELDQFFSGMRALSMALSFVMLKQLIGHRSEFQSFQFTATQSQDKSEFCKLLSEVSDISPTTTDHIINRLEYDDRTNAPCIFQQPLLVSKGVVHWSPSLMQKSAYRRNMLRLMARTPSLKAIADNEIGNRESKLLQELEQMLSGSCRCKLNTDISNGGESTEVDLLAYNAKYPQQLLLVEGKSFLPADEINEVDAATKEMIHGQSQIETAKRILQRMSLSERTKLFPMVNWDEVKEVYGMVITPDTEPHQGLDHTIIPAISLLSLTENMDASALSKT